MKLILFFFMFFSFHLDTTGHNCKVRFSFKKICHRFKVDSECQPPNQTNLCKRTKTTFEDSKCPIYFCTSTETQLEDPKVKLSTTQGTPIKQPIIEATVTEPTNVKQTTSEATSRTSESRTTQLTTTKLPESPKKERTIKPAISTQTTTTQVPESQKIEPMPIKQEINKITIEPREIHNFLPSRRTTTTRSTTASTTASTTETTAATRIILTTETSSSVSRSTTTRSTTKTSPTTVSSSTISTSTRSRRKDEATSPLDENNKRMRFNDLITTYRRASREQKIGAKSKSEDPTLVTPKNAIRQNQFSTNDTSFNPSLSKSIKNERRFKQSSVGESNKNTSINRSSFNDTQKVIVQSNELKMKKPEQYRSIDCHDKECSLRHQILANCIVYLHTNNSNCNIPCKLDGCEKEMHHYINCPIWNCIPYTTTTSTTTSTTLQTTTQTTDTTSTPYSTDTTTTPQTTSRPSPSPNPCPTFETQSIMLYISILLNIFFVIIVIFLSIYIHKKKFAPKSKNTHNRRRVSLLDNNDHYFSIASESSHESTTENLPLLDRNPNASMLRNRANLGLTPPVQIHAPQGPTAHASNFENINLNSPNSISPKSTSPNQRTLDHVRIEQEQASFRLRHAFSTFKGYENVESNSENSPLLKKQ